MYVYIEGERLTWEKYKEICQVFRLESLGSRQALARLSLAEKREEAFI